MRVLLGVICSDAIEEPKRKMCHDARVPTQNTHFTLGLLS